MKSFLTLIKFLKFTQLVKTQGTQSASASAASTASDAASEEAKISGHFEKSPYQKRNKRILEEIVSLISWEGKL